MRLEKKNAGLLKCKALKLKKKLANSSSLSVENLEAKTFDQRGWTTFKRNRLGKCVFNDLPVYAVVEKVSLIQRVCTKKHCQSLPSFSSTVRLSAFRSRTQNVCAVEGGGRNFSLPVAIVFCYVLCLFSLSPGSEK